LKATGYSTKIIGKWHCGDQQEFLPTNFGFDEYFGIPYSNDIGRQVNYVPQRYPPLPLMRNKEVAQEQPDQRALTERYTTEACNFIQDNKDEPFFLYFAHMHVHVPIFVPKRFLDNSDNGGYGAAVEEIDWSTGMLMDKLEQLGLSENTLIIFTSDNGSRARGEGGSNGACRGHKGQTWDGGLRVPCIMRWPDQIEAGQSNTEVSTAMDFFATLSHVAGAELPDDRVIDSKNIYPLMTDTTAKSETDCFGYYVYDELQAVRCGDWKLHVWRKNGVVKELYNLLDDIGETTNVYDQHQELVSEMEAKAQRMREDIGDTATGVEGANRRLKGVVENPRTYLVRDAESAYLDLQTDNDDAMVNIVGSSISYRLAFGPNAGKKALTLQTLPTSDTEDLRSLVTKQSGFSLHAGVSCKAGQQKKLERLCRYITRPAISEQRLSIAGNGNVIYALKTPYSDGTTHVVLSPLEFIGRLAALVPKPRVNLTRFHGVFSPNSKLRKKVVPAKPLQNKPSSGKPGVYGQTWAQRLKRVFAIDIEKCEKCGGKMKVIASIEDPDVIDKILKHLGFDQSGSLHSSPHNRSPPENRFGHTTTLF